MRSAVSSREPVAAPARERPAVAQLARALESLSNGQLARPPRLLIRPGEEIELPETVLGLLHSLVRHLARGSSVTLIPLPEHLTTQQAADVLNVPWTYLVELAEQGVVPSTGDGPDRRIRFDDLMAYKKQRDERRREGLRRLTQMSQEYGLYGEAQRRAEQA